MLSFVLRGVWRFALPILAKNDRIDANKIADGLRCEWESRHSRPSPDQPETTKTRWLQA
jgi:hypothetical protein